MAKPCPEDTLMIMKLMLWSMFFFLGACSPSEFEKNKELIRSNEECEYYVKLSNWEKALPHCRRALLEESDDPRLLELSAQVELEAGSAERTIALLEKLSHIRPLADSEQKVLARAHWREGNFSEAEKIFITQLEKETSRENYEALLGLYNAFLKWELLDQYSSHAVTDFPEHCVFIDYQIVSAVMNQKIKVVETLLERSTQLHCTQYEWIFSGDLSQILKEKSIVEILDPKDIVRVAADSETEKSRLLITLLAAMDIQNIEDDLCQLCMATQDFETRKQTLELMLRYPEKTVSCLRQLLDQENIMLRRETLRMMWGHQDLVLLPLLEHHFLSEQAPGNKNLTALLLGALYRQQGEFKKADSFLSQVSESDTVYPLTVLEKARLAEAEGRVDDARGLLERAESEFSVFDEEMRKRLSPLRDR